VAIAFPQCEIQFYYFLVSADMKIFLQLDETVARMKKKVGDYISLSKETHCLNEKENISKKIKKIVSSL
jgi:hypothetical protein